MRERKRNEICGFDHKNSHFALAEVGIRIFGMEEDFVVAVGDAAVAGEDFGFVAKDMLCVLFMICVWVSDTVGKP